MSSANYIKYLNSVANTILYYPVLISLPLVIIGNLFSFFIYTRPNLNKKTNTGFLFAWLCLLNICFMLIIVLINLSKSLFGFQANLPCGLSSYIFRMGYCLVPWMHVIISFDRFISVVFPTKTRIMNKKWVLSLIMLGTFALLAVSNVPNLLTYPNSSGTNCFTANDVLIARLVLTILFRTYIPFALMLVMDIMVFKRLRQSRRRVGVTQTGQSNHSHQISNKEYNFMISTLLIDLSFVVFYTPISIHLTITLTTLFVTYDQVSSTAVNVFYSCALLIAIFYSVLTFFFFFVFNRYFRSEVYTVLRIRMLFPHISQSVMKPSSNNNNMKKELWIK